MKELERLCEAYRPYCVMENCPIAIEKSKDCDDSLCREYICEHSQKAISIVQQWSDNHPAPPPKTYADAVFEKFPNALKHKGMPRMCKLWVTGGYKDHNECEPYPDACIACWNEPYTEQG